MRPKVSTVKEGRPSAQGGARSTYNLSADYRTNRWRQALRGWQLYAMIAIPLVYIIVFWYVPMYGAQIAFRRYLPTQGIWNSPWVGLLHFKRFFTSAQFKTVVSNTFTLSLYVLLAGIPAPIILALALNSSTIARFAKIVQTTTYLPYFISTVVMVGIIIQVLSPQIGIVALVFKLFGVAPINFLADPRLFRSAYVWSGIWQATGWGSVVYLAALSAIDPTLHEAAVVDGASRFRRILHIDLPGILPVATILLILNTGNILYVGFEKIFLMQNDLNLPASEVIQTYLYKVSFSVKGLGIPNYSYSTAIGLFNSVVSFVLLFAVNKLAKKIGETSLW